MMRIYKSNNDGLNQINEITPNSWIDLVSPSNDEIDKVVKATKIDKDLITKMLDDNELPRIESSQLILSVLLCPIEIIS